MDDRQKKISELQKSIDKMKIAWMKFREALEEARKLTEEFTEELARMDDEEESSFKTLDGLKRVHISKDGRLRWENSESERKFYEKISEYTRDD